ncbi:MAG: histidine kinase [Tannerella sp.]|nr:histidine kinase [Tannerella sp.]
MKKRIVFISILLQSIYFINAQNPADQQSRLLDSVMNLMKDKSIPFLERYYMTAGIDILERTNQIAVLKELIPEAKDYEDKAVITRLYSLISLNYTLSAHYSEAETYMDSAFSHVDEIDNITIKGLAYYNAGTFYTRLNNISEAHDHFYKAAEYFKMKDPKLNILNEVYYNLSFIYAYRNDVENLKELCSWIKEITVRYPAQKILQLTTQARYFQALYNRTGDFSYLDSVTMYNQIAFDIFHSEEQPHDVAYQIAENYLSQAVAFYYKSEPDSAEYYLNQTKEFVYSNDFYTKVQINYLSGHLLFLKEEYEQAETVLLNGLEEFSVSIGTQENYFYNTLSDYYDILSQIQEKRGKVKEALESGRKSLQYDRLFFDINNHEYIQDLKTRYDVGNKERAIEQLSKINEMNQKTRVLYIGIAILLLIIIFLITYLFKRKQKITQAKLQESKLISELEKEKNATLASKMEENEQKYQLLLSENKLKQVNSYLEGLESERSRLSKELHDNVTNNIYSANMLLKSPENVNISEVSDMLSSIQEHVRTISHELIPPSFQYVTFIEILKDYINQQNKNGKTRIFLSINSEKELNDMPEKSGLELYRIIQECVSNTLKHANASQLEIFLYIENQQINLTIIDNGTGFDINTKHKGIGLIIINERTKSLNGTLQIHSTLNKGTEINIIIPCRQEYQ